MICYLKILFCENILIILEQFKIVHKTFIIQNIFQLQKIPYTREAQQEMSDMFQLWNTILIKTLSKGRYSITDRIEKIVEV